MHCSSVYKAAFTNKQSRPQGLQEQGISIQMIIRKYPAKHDAYSSIDPLTLKRATGNSEHGNILLLDHVQDLCISGEDETPEE